MLQRSARVALGPPDILQAPIGANPAESTKRLSKIRDLRRAATRIHFPTAPCRPPTKMMTRRRGSRDYHHRNFRRTPDRRSQLIGFSFVAAKRELEVVAGAF